MPFLKWVSNRFEQFPTDCSEIEPEIRVLIKDGNDIARLLEIHTLLKMEGNSSLDTEHPVKQHLKNLQRHLEGDESSRDTQNVDQSPQICWCSHRESILER